MILNKYNRWYGLYKEQSKEKYPYKITKIENDIGVDIPGLEDVRIDAYSSSQARFLFLDRYTRLKDYLANGFEIEAELDNELLKQRKEIEVYEKEREEERYKNAWYYDN